MIYLDNAATTPIKNEVIAEMQKVMTDNYGNPSSIHQVGRKANFALLTARQVLAKTINANENEIIFTSSGSEGDNLALQGVAHALQNKGKHIITSAIEHPAVLNTLRHLETEGYEVTYLPVNEQGNISLEQVQAAVRPDTILASLMYGNNEVGTIFPLFEIVPWLKEQGILVHTDAVQAYGIEEIDVQTLPVDLLTVTAHKINGPKGTGFLYVRKGTPLQPLIYGGSQENKLRAGTENLPAIVGFAVAAESLTTDKKATLRAKYQHYQKLITQSLDNAGVAYQINGEEEHKLPHVMSLWLKDVPSQILLTHLDLAGIAVSAGSACTAGNVTHSHVLEAMYGDESKALNETIRLSFGQVNEENDIMEFIESLKNIIIKIKQ